MTTQPNRIGVFLFTILAASTCGAQGFFPIEGASKFKEIKSFSYGTENAFAFAADANERLVATGNSDSTLAVWDLATGKKLRQWKPSAGAVKDIDFAPSGTNLVSVSIPRSLTLFDTSNNLQLWQTQCPNPPSRVAFSRDGKYIATASFTGKAAVFNAADGKLIATMNHDLATSNGVAFSLDGKSLFVGTRPARGGSTISELVVCDPRTGKQVKSVGKHDEFIMRVNLSPDGSRIVSVDRSGSIKLWDTITFRLVNHWKGDVEGSNHGVFLGEHHVVVGGRDRIVLYREGNAAMVSSLDLPGPMNHIATLPSKSIALSAVNKKVHVLSLAGEIEEPKAVKTVEQVGPPKVAAEKKMPAVKMPAVKMPVVKVQVVNAGPNEPLKNPFRRQDNKPPTGAKFDGLVTFDQLGQLIGQPVSLKLRSGLFISGATLNELQFDRTGNGLRFLKYRLDSGRLATAKAPDIYRVAIGKSMYHLRYFQPLQQLFLINTKEANELAASRLAEKRRTIRTLLDEDAQREATNEHKVFLSDAVKKLQKDGNFHVIETESTLIFTNFPVAATSGLQRYVDSLNLSLNRAFGVPESDSIWRGKAILAVFTNKAAFGAFEEKVMDNPNHGGNPGVRTSEKRFLYTIVAKKLEKRVAQGIGWSYSLGFADRLHSDARGMPWLNFGIANRMRFVITPDPKVESTQRKNVTRQLQNTKTLLGLLTATRIDNDRWPVAGLVTKYLVSLDAVAFGQLFQDVKLGVDVKEALKQNYDMTINELAANFGRSLGVAGVKP